MTTSSLTSVALDVVPVATVPDQAPESQDSATSRYPTVIKTAEVASWCIALFATTVIIYQGATENKDPLVYVCAGLLLFVGVGLGYTLRKMQHMLSFESQVNQFRASNTTLTAQVTRLENASALQQRQFNEQNAALTTQVTNLQSTNGALTTQVANLQNTNTQFSERNTELTTQVANLRNTNALQASQFNEQNTQLTTRVTDLTGQVEKFRVENSNLERSVRSLAKTTGDAEQVIQAVKGEFAEEFRKLAELTERQRVNTQMDEKTNEVTEGLLTRLSGVANQLEHNTASSASSRSSLAASTSTKSTASTTSLLIDAVD